MNIYLMQLFVYKIFIDLLREQAYSCLILISFFIYRK